jgi:DHA1 family multidrug resistance protein-like MFS transporter
MDRRKVYLLTISLMYGVLFSLGNPALPQYTKSLGISDTMVGFYLASTGLGLLVFATLWGALGDIKNRDKVLALIFAGYGVGQILFGIFRSEYTLLFASLFSGVFFAGVLVNVYSYINDTFTDEHERNKMLSYNVSLYLIGGAIAYIIGGVLSDFLAPRFYLVFIIQGVLLLLFALYVYISKFDLVDTDHHLTRQHLWNNVKQSFKLPWVPIFTITLTFFISFSHQNVRRWLDYYIIDEGYSATMLGIIVFIAGVISLLANIYIAPFFLRRMHNFRFLQIQFIFAPILLVLAFTTENMLVGLFTYYMGYTLILAVYEPTAISFMSDNKAVSQGVLVGVRQSIVGLGTTLGFIIGGILYGIDHLYVFYLAVLFYIIVFIGFSVLIMIKYKDVKEYRRNYKEVSKND